MFGVELVIVLLVIYFGVWFGGIGIGFVGGFGVFVLMFIF